MLINEIWRYPVKSTIGKRVTEAEVNLSGIVGDRIRASRDLERRGFRCANKIGAACSSRTNSERPWAASTANR